MQTRRRGLAILSGSEFPVFQMGQRIALGNHEDWEGSGYPAGLTVGEAEIWSQPWRPRSDVDEYTRRFPSPRE